MLPSIFKISDFPLHAAYEMATDDSSFRTITGCFLGAAVLPVAVAAVPITILADVIVGIAEGSFAAYKKGFTLETRDMFYKKIVVSPVQQLTFAMTVSSLAWGILKIGKGVPYLFFFEAWIFFYLAGQKMVSKLPDCINQKQLNIFIDHKKQESDSCSSDDELEDTIKRRIVKMTNGEKILKIVSVEVIKHAKANKILGIRPDDIDSLQSAYFETATRLIIFETIYACHSNHQDAIILYLKKLSNCTEHFLGALIKRVKGFCPEEIDNLKAILLNVLDNTKGEETDTAFKEIGTLTTLCLKKKEFYSLFQS